MYGKPPSEVNWLEIRILNRLNDRRHPVALRDLRENLVPDKQETIVCTCANMRDEGLVRMFEIPGQSGKLVEITSVGKALLFDVLNSRSNCD
jgi:hypothetical protein